MLAAPPCLRFPTWCERKTIIRVGLGGLSNLNSAAYITQLQSHSSTCLCMKFDVKLTRFNFLKLMKLPEFQKCVHNYLRSNRNNPHQFKHYCIIISETQSGGNVEMYVEQSFASRYFET